MKCSSMVVHSITDKNQNYNLEKEKSKKKLKLSFKILPRVAYRNSVFVIPMAVHRKDDKKDKIFKKIKEHTLKFL